jgi:hypothetical protein
MTTTLVIRHKVDNYADWRAVYESLEPLRAQHGCTAARVLQLSADSNDLLITHDFGTTEQAVSYAGDPELKAGMERAGVAGPPLIEIFAVA